MRQEIGEANAVVIIDAGTRKIMTAFASDTIGGISWFRWAGNDQILFSSSALGFVYIYPVPVTQLRVFDLRTKETREIVLKEQGFEGDDVLHVDPSGRYIIWSVAKDSFTEPDVWRFPLDGSGEDGAVLVQKRLGKIDEWWADDTGQVRLGMGFTSGGSAIVYYRPDGVSNMQRITKLKKGSDQYKQWNARCIYAGSDEGYAFVEGEDGRSELRRFNYATAEATSLVYANTDWGVDTIIVDRSQKPVGAKYTDDRSKTVWFDEKLAKEQQNLERALGNGDVSIISFAGYDRMLVHHGSASDPGALYIYTPGERRLDLFADYRPNIDYRLLAPTKAVTFPARDGARISAYLTQPRGRGEGNFPLIILPHGGPFGVRDELVYNDEVQLLANRGYAVLQPNFRGSGGYGDAFFELGEGQVGRGMQDDLDDAMDWAVAQGIADKDRVCLVGASYGGYAAMWGILRNPDRYRCAASWAGVTDWDEMLKYDNKFLSRKDGKEWRQIIEGDDDKDADIDDVSPYRQAGLLSRPLLLAHGTADDNVPISQYERMVKATKDKQELVTLLEIKGEGHSFSKKENEKAWYDALVAFLAKHNPAD